MHVAIIIYPLMRKRLVNDGPGTGQAMVPFSRLLATRRTFAA